MGPHIPAKERIGLATPPHIDPPMRPEERRRQLSRLHRAGTGPNERLIYCGCGWVGTIEMLDDLDYGPGQIDEWRNHRREVGIR